MTRSSAGQVYQIGLSQQDLCEFQVKRIDAPIRDQGQQDPRFPHGSNQESARRVPGPNRPIAATSNRYICTCIYASSSFNVSMQKIYVRSAGFHSANKASIGIEPQSQCNQILQEGANLGAKYRCEIVCMVKIVLGADQSSTREQQSYIANKSANVEQPDRSGQVQQRRGVRAASPQVPGPRCLI